MEEIIKVSFRLDQYNSVDNKWYVMLDDLDTLEVAQYYLEKCNNMREHLSNREKLTWTKSRIVKIVKTTYV